MGSDEVGSPFETTLLNEHLIWGVAASSYILSNSAFWLFCSEVDVVLN